MANTIPMPDMSGAASGEHYAHDKFPLFAGSAERRSSTATAGATAISQFEVCKVAGTGEVEALVAADINAGVEVVIAQHAAEPGEPVNYWYTGEFFTDALVWAADIDTDTERLMAGRGASVPSQITFRKHPYQPPVV